MSGDSYRGSTDTIGTVKRGSDWLALALIVFYLGCLMIPIYLVKLA